MTVLAILLAGGLGAVARFVVDGASKAWLARRAHPSQIPLATLVINVTGSLLLGILAGLVMFQSAPAEIQMVVGTGFCGGYTTFSTASFETVRLAQGRNSLHAATYALGSLVASVAACAVGLVIAWS